MNGKPESCDCRQNKLSKVRKKPASVKETISTRRSLMAITAQAMKNVRGNLGLTTRKANSHGVQETIKMIQMMKQNTIVLCVSRHIQTAESREKWIQCITCENWVHLACTDGDKQYICYHCLSDND